MTSITILIILMTSITILILRSVMWSNDVGEQAQSACFSPDGEVGDNYFSSYEIFLSIVPS